MNHFPTVSVQKLLIVCLLTSRNNLIDPFHHQKKVKNTPLADIINIFTIKKGLMVNLVKTKNTTYSDSKYAFFEFQLNNNNI